MIIIIIDMRILYKMLNITVYFYYAKHINDKTKTFS